MCYSLEIIRQVLWSIVGTNRSITPNLLALLVDILGVAKEIGTGLQSY